MIKKLLRILLVFVVLVAVGGAAWFAHSAWRSARDARERAASPQGRLPDGVRPVAYDLELRVDPGRKRFAGELAIRIEVARPTDVIWLHGRELDAREAAMVTADGRRLRADYREMGRSGVVRLRPETPLEAGPATLEISFTGTLGSKLAGAYRVVEGEKAYVYTQFQPTDARRAFPCFDEPAFKTPFDVALVVPQNLRAFANAPETTREPEDDGFERLRFATTPPLPTYLVAFAVGPFDVVEWQAVPPNSLRSDPVPLRGIAASGRGGKLGYALAHTAATLGLLEEYFASPYPFRKLDLVAVPELAFGAMENPGLVTYREEILSVGDEASAQKRRELALTHAHELAHQWHGNLVTMPWWDDLWLNESFATWIQARIAEAWDPGLGFGRERVRSAHGVMRADGYVSARQIRQRIESPHDVESAFDGITYAKGAAVVRMFEAFVGEERFRAGVRAHMERFARGHATTEDFLESIATVLDETATEGEAQGGEAFVQAFRSFVEQPGVPLLRADWTCDGGAPEIRLAQSRYLPVGSKGSPEALWRMPVCVKTLGGDGVRSECLFLTEPAATLGVEGRICPSAVMPNAGAEGYYRWSLPREGWTALLDSLDRLSAEEVYSVADNLEAELRAGRVDVGFYLDAARAFAGLDEWDLVTAPIDELRFIAHYFDPDGLMREYMEDLYLPRYRRLGLVADTDLDRADPVSAALLRSRLVTFLALDARSSEVRSDLLGPAKTFMGFETGMALESGAPVDASAIHPDLLTAALTVAVEELGEPFYEALVELVESSDDVDLRQKALLALGQVADPELSRRARGLVLSWSLSLNDKLFVMFGQMRHPANQEALYGWLKSSYGAVAPFLPDAYLSQVPMIASNFCDGEHYEDVKAFFEPRLRDVLGGPRSLVTVLEQIELCAALVASQPEFDVPSLRVVLDKSGELH